MLDLAIPVDSTSKQRKKDNKAKECVKYITRYTARRAMADSIDRNKNYSSLVT